MLAHDFISIDTPFREQLQRARLDSVKAVLACVGDRLAAWSRTSDTIWCDLPFSSSSVYVKRYHYPRWSHRLRGMLRGTFLSNSRARSEFVALRLMRQLGIQAVRPVAFGERRVAHFVRSCFLITEAVPDAMPLSTFIKTFGDRRDSVQERRGRRDILTSLARQVRHMHEAGFVHHDLFWRNVLIRFLPDSRFEFYFLDASVGKRIRMPHRRQDSIVWDIAAMGALAPDFCSKADQMRFLLTYLDAPRLGLQDRQWLRRVQARSDLFRESELQRFHRSHVFDPPMLASDRSA
jgi:tRNA A-37 threonylcarbamoyl transferase component Bud32